MRYGVCFGTDDPTKIAAAKAAGFDYVECGFSSFVHDSDEKLGAFRQALEENGLQAEAANCFIPGELPLIGSGYDPAAVRAYVEKGLARGTPLGLKKISLGSSYARRVPEGMAYTDAVRALARAIDEVLAPACAQYGVTIAIEPLNKQECRTLNTLREGALLAAAVNRDNVKLLADLYHMERIGETGEDVRLMKGVLAHGHISQPFSDRGMKREFPTDPAAFDYTGFVQALADAGVDTCSIEAATKDFFADVAAAGKVLRSLRIK